MKRLIIVRHAQAQPEIGVGGDYERTLTERGEREAQLMGRRLAERGLAPERLLSSSAPRARHTAEILAQALRVSAADIAEETGLYLASREKLLEYLRAQPDSVNLLVLVGHESGLSELCRLLTDVRIDALPTVGVFAIDFDVAGWQALAPGEGVFVFFDAPALAAP